MIFMYKHTDDIISKKAQKFNEKRACLKASSSAQSLFCVISGIEKRSQFLVESLVINGL